MQITRHTLNLDPPPFDTGRPLSSNRLCPLSSMHRLQKARQNQSLRLSSLGLHPGSRWSPMSAVGGGLISSRTARGVRMNLVLAMVFQRHVRRKAVLFPATRAQAAEAGLLLHKLASSWLRGEASMDSYSTRRLTSAMNNMCSALVTSAALGATHFAPHSAVC